MKKFNPASCSPSRLRPYAVRFRFERKLIQLALYIVMVSGATSREPFLASTWPVFLHFAVEFVDNCCGGFLGANMATFNCVSSTPATPNRKSIRDRHRRELPRCVSESAIELSASRAPSMAVVLTYIDAESV